MGNYDEFDLDVRLGSGSSLAGSPRALDGRDLTDNCGTHQTCAGQQTCGTCATLCGQPTCVDTCNTCGTCDTLCAGTCFDTCVTCPGQNTCHHQDPCHTCDTCQPCVTDCGQVTCHPICIE